MTKASKTVSSSEDSKKKKPSKSVGNQIKVRKLWTPEEDNIVINKVRDHPENLTLAFDLASKELKDRSPLSCAQRWYSYISRKTGKDSVALMCVSNRSYGRNRKNIKTEINKNEASKWMTLWKAITNFFE